MYVVYMYEGYTYNIHTYIHTYIHIHTYIYLYGGLFLILHMGPPKIRGIKCIKIFKIWFFWVMGDSHYF